MFHKDCSEALNYMRAAEMHRDAARALLIYAHGVARSILGCEVVYLSGYVAECSMKALLLSYTPKSRRLAILEEMKNPSRLGHDLELIRKELAKRICEMPVIQMRSMRRVRENWSSQLRYNARKWPVADATIVFEAAEDLYRWVEGGRS